MTPSSGWSTLLVSEKMLESSVMAAMLTPNLLCSAGPSGVSIAP